MATIVDTPSAESDQGAGFFLGIALLVVVLFLFFYFGIPMLRWAGSGVQVPHVNVPEKIDVQIRLPQEMAPQQ